MKKLFSESIAFLFTLLVLTGCSGKTDIEKGYDAFKDGNYDKAAKHFQSAAEENPTAYHISYNEGVAHSLAGDRDEAIASFRSVLKFSPGDKYTTEYLAVELLKGNSRAEFVEAHELLSGLLQYELAAGDRARILSTLSKADLLINRKDLALGHLILARHIDSNYAPAVFNLAKLCGDSFNSYLYADQLMQIYFTLSKNDGTNFKVANNYFEVVTRKKNAIQPHYTSSKASDLIEKGRTELRKGKYAMAIKRFDEAIKADPQSYEAYYEKGNALTASKRTSDAIIAYGKAYQNNPQKIEAVISQVNLLHGSADYEGTIDVMINQLLSKTDMPYVMAYIRLVYSYASLGRLYEAKLFGEIAYSVCEKLPGERAANIDNFMKFYDTSLRSRDTKLVY